MHSLRMFISVHKGACADFGLTLQTTNLKFPVTSLPMRLLRMCRGARGINMATSSSKLKVKKPNTTSSVWNCFGITADETGVPIHAERDKPICRLCKKQCLPSARTQQTYSLTWKTITPAFFLKLYQQHPVFRNESRLHW